VPLPRCGTGGGQSSRCRQDPRGRVQNVYRRYLCGVFEKGSRTNLRVISAVTSAAGVRSGAGVRSIRRLAGGAGSAGAAKLGAFWVHFARRQMLWGSVTVRRPLERLALGGGGRRKTLMRYPRGNRRHPRNSRISPATKRLGRGVALQVPNREICATGWFADSDVLPPGDMRGTGRSGTGVCAGPKSAIGEELRTLA